jgi:hypothetical protein
MSDDDPKDSEERERIERAAQGLDLLGGVLSGGLAGGLSGLVDRLREHARELEREGTIERSGEFGGDNDGKMRGGFNVRISSLGDARSSMPPRGVARGPARAPSRASTPTPDARPKRTTPREIVVGPAHEPRVEVFDEGEGRARVLIEMPGLTPARVECELDGDLLLVRVRGEEALHELEVLLPAPARSYALEPGEGLVIVSLHP